MRAHASLIYVGICLIFLFGLHRHDFPLLATKIHNSYNLTYVKVRKNDPFIRGGKKKASLSLHHLVTKNTFCSWSTRKGPVNQDWQQFENVFYFFLLEVRRFLVTASTLPSNQRYLSATMFTFGKHKKLFACITISIWYLHCAWLI